MFCTAKDRLLQRKTWHIAAPFAVLSVYGLFCVSAVSVFRLFLCFVCFRVLFVSAFRRFLCFGVICNPPNYTIRICNPLKPPRLAVCKQGLFNRIANPYNKNRRIANPPERNVIDWHEKHHWPSRVLPLAGTEKPVPVQPFADPTGISHTGHSQAHQKR